MTKKKKQALRIVVATELEWPMRRHYELLGGVQEYARQHTDWQVEASRFPEIQMQEGAQFDGVVGRIDTDTYEAAKGAGIPMVNVMVSSDIRDKIPGVFVDQYTGGRWAALHLIRRGMRRLINIEGHVWKGQHHSQGIRDIAKEHHIPLRHCRVAQHLETHSRHWQSAARALKRCLKNWEPPVGIVAGQDTNARVALTLLQEQGWVTPTSLAAVGMGNEDIICMATDPSLSSIDLGYLRNGYEAARILDSIIQGHPPPDQPIVVPPKGLMVRGSSDVFASRDPLVQEALLFLSENAHRHVPVPEVARVAGISRQVLERRFRKELNTTIHSEHIRLRIERIKRLLVEHADASVKEIGSDSGFSSLSSFYSVFKERTGMTPQEYRDQHADPHRW